MLKVKIYKVTACLVILMLVTVCGFAQQKIISKPIKQRDTVGHEPAPDKALLNKFELLCKKMSNTNGNYTMAGIINIVNKANPDDKMENVDFLFCKQGDEFYYKLGQTTTIDEQGVYLFIDYKTKRIIVSQGKKVVYDAALKQFGDLGAKVYGENYKLLDKVNGDDETLSLINEHHISCKQYSITFNRQTLKIKKLFMRLTNFSDPLRTDNEKTVNVNITRWDNGADITKYLSKNNVVKNINGGWKTVSEFKNYQLIKM
jgi:hypothetical protein